MLRRLRRLHFRILVPRHLIRRQQSRALNIRCTSHQAPLAQELTVNSTSPKKTEPRWPALVALVGAGALYAALPSSLLIAGTRWLLPALILLLIIPVEVSHRRGN